MLEPVPVRALMTISVLMMASASALALLVAVSAFMASTRSASP